MHTSNVAPDSVLKFIRTESVVLS